MDNVNFFRKCDGKLFIQAENKPIQIYTIFENLDDIEELKLDLQLTSVNCKHEFKVSKC